MHDSNYKIVKKHESIPVWCKHDISVPVYDLLDYKNGKTISWEDKGIDDTTGRDVKYTAHLKVVKNRTNVMYIRVVEWRRTFKSTTYGVTEYLVKK